MIQPLLMLAAAALAAGGGWSTVVRVPAPPVAVPIPDDLPALTGRVVDNANLLATGREALLAWALAETERSTKHQFVVVTLPTLNDKSIERVGRELGKGWGIGRKGYNDGVLLIVAPNERKVRIEVGVGLEMALNDAEAKAIIEQRILPRFRKGNMESGILMGSAGIIREIGAPGAKR